ncbi:MAG: hypothetical protein HRT87_04565 [Legionellales bacterium]|nr:hypothetical protein [Legionellales bacterium]
MTPEQKILKVIILISQNKEFFAEFLKGQTVQFKESIRDPHGLAIRDKHYIREWYFDRTTDPVDKNKYLDTMNNFFKIIGEEATIESYSIEQLLSLVKTHKIKVTRDRPIDYKYNPKITAFQNSLNKCIRGVLSPERTKRRLKTLPTIDPKVYQKDIRVHDYVWSRSNSDDLKNYLMDNPELVDFFLEENIQKDIVEMSEKFSTWWKKKKRREQYVPKNESNTVIPKQRSTLYEKLRSKAMRKNPTAFSNLSSIVEDPVELGLKKIHGIVKEFSNVREKYSSNRQWYKSLFILTTRTYKRRTQLRSLDKAVQEFITEPDYPKLKILLDTIIDTKKNIVGEKQRKFANRVFSSALEKVLDDLSEKIINEIPKDLLVNIQEANPDLSFQLNTISNFKK